MFDGVHLGHQSIISELNLIAEKKSLQSAVLTFWPHPRLVFNPDEDLRLLNTLEEKSALLEQLGIQHLFLKERSEEHTSELQSRENLVCRLLLEKKKKK